MKPALIAFLAISIAVCMSQDPISFQNTFPLSYTGSGYSINFTTEAGSDSETLPISMLIDLISPQTILFNATCFGFSSIYIGGSDCISEGIASYWPYYNIQLSNCSTSIYVNMSYPSNLNNLAILSSINVYCYPYDTPGPFTVSSNNSLIYGENTYGTVGFGYKQGSDNQTYILTPGFNMMTIYLNRTAYNGFLTLGSPNLTYATTRTPIISLPTLQNSPIANITVLQGIGDFNSFQYGNTTISVSALQPSTILWDLNSPYLAFPLSIYQDILSTISSSGFFAYCQNGTVEGAGVLCSLANGIVSSLPVLYINAGNIIIPIPPQIYVQDYEMLLQNDTNSMLRLNFEYIEEDESDYMTNMTIFGACFFYYYYTVFNAANKTVDLYVSVDSFLTSQPVTDTPMKGNSLAWIIPIAIILILVVCLLLYKWHKRRQVKDIENPPSDVKFQGNGSLDIDLQSQFDHLVPSR